MTTLALLIRPEPISAVRMPGKQHLSGIVNVQLRNQCTSDTRSVYIIHGHIMHVRCRTSLSHHMRSQNSISTPTDQVQSRKVFLQSRHLCISTTSGHLHQLRTRLFLPRTCVCPQDCEPNASILQDFQQRVATAPIVNTLNQI